MAMRLGTQGADRDIRIPPVLIHLRHGAIPITAAYNLQGELIGYTSVA